MPSDAVDIESVWRRLRALRHQPPGRAGRGDRRRVFGSALEQCEQLFRAAAGVGYASRPILLLYALSQAGRAIAAASITTENNAYRLTGHGIEVPDLNQHPPLHCLTLMDKGRGSFTQLASILGSGSLPAGTSLGQAWTTIPDLLDWPPDHPGTDYKKPLRIVDMYPRSTRAGDRMVARVVGLPTRNPGEPPRSEAEIASYLSSYPTIGMTEYPDLIGVPDQFSEPLGRTEWATAEWRVWPRAVPAADSYLTNQITQPYLTDDDRWAFPAIGGSDRPLHPLMAWWAVLFALSMLARYEPANWTQHLDVDASPNAVPLETTLNRALDAGPRLILRVIQEVSID